MDTRYVRELTPALFCLTTVMVSVTFVPAQAWSNGGLSSDAENPKYGTHDWLAHHALDWVPDNLSSWIKTRLATYLYGTELPDNRNAPLGDGIGDTYLHHAYYRSDGRLQDDSAARRSQEACDRVLSSLTAGDHREAAKWMGIVAHYICDLAVFGHVMGSSTDWGSEKHHQDYEQWVNSLTDQYNSSFTIYLRFDGKLDSISAYDAALRLAHDTTFDETGRGRTAKWMDDNYDPADQRFRERVVESLNLAVNLLADVIFTTSQTAGIPEMQAPTTAFVLLLAAVIVIARRPGRRTRRESLGV